MVDELIGGINFSHDQHSTLISKYMNINGLKKRSTVLWRKINEHSELKKMKGYENPALSSFVKSFEAVKNDSFTKKDIEAFKRCEIYRNRLLQDDTIISYEVFGSSNTMIVKTICHIAASSPTWGRFLYSISQKSGALNILEIGTNLGISGAYILEAIKDKKEAQFTTMEGAPQLCEISSNQFKSIIEEHRFKVVQGLYDETMPKVLNSQIQYDLHFIDGNHHKEATIEYFEKFKDKAANPGLFVFDDIRWSKGMWEAWNTIIKDKDVNFSIDIYKMGVVIVDKNNKNKKRNFYLFLA